MTQEEVTKARAVAQEIKERQESKSVTRRKQIQVTRIDEKTGAVTTVAIPKKTKK